ncbi:MAG TPA: hypothetical protein ENI19_03855 [Candidatus Nealsonbacteria bacterium]|uniref:Uncharacterized protein n=1 Tax=marine sediment metagenome TaxID=412755 RepID=A0A0F9VS89_9ZZZZ|nr:hypothetical protein [Candidatus Nealsonbacteria bacterium]HEB46804.1 hypothetical protein [Candidatus Nealsonbacteria bacterium]
MDVEIKKKEQIESGWNFLVGIDDIEYAVTLDKEYWEKLTPSTSSGQAHGQLTPEELVRKSFEFLLEREPKESILREFNLNVISKYFPEYEKEIIK